MREIIPLHLTAGIAKILMHVSTNIDLEQMLLIDYHSEQYTP
jgi:hypothetical protein